MASSLRKRLGRRAGLTDLKTSGSGGEGDSASSSEVSLKAAAQDDSPERQKQKETVKPSVAWQDLSGTPPPNRKLRSSKDFSVGRNKTPPKALLEKYKGKSAKQAVPLAARSTTTRRSGSASSAGSAKSKEERKDSTLPSPVSPTEPKHVSEFEEAKKANETRKVRGVEFDMVNHSKTNISNADATRHGPAKGDEGKEKEFQHRRTRSQARREERKSPSPEMLSDDLKMLDLDTAPELPAPLSIRKVDRTPSPRAAETTRDGLWDSAREWENKQQKSQSLSPPTQSSSRAKHTRNPAIVNQAVANLLTAPRAPPPQDQASDSDPEAHTPPRIRQSLLGNTTTISSTTGQYTSTPQKPKLKPNSNSPSNGTELTPPAIKVHPPIPFPDVPAGYTFCSHLHGTSRPVEPWAWCKRWTCCACGPGDEGDGGTFDVAAGRPGDGSGRQFVAGFAEKGEGEVGGNVLFNGRGEARPAVTMAEQRVCSRLGCGHLRCRGCWVEC